MHSEETTYRTFLRKELKRLENTCFSGVSGAAGFDANSKIF